MEKKSLGFIGGLLFVLLSFLITPFGALVVYLLMFKEKEDQKWKTTKKLFWSLVGSSLLILFAFLVFWVAQVVDFVLVDSYVRIIVMNVAPLISFALLLSPLALLWYIWWRKK